MWDGSQMGSGISGGGEGGETVGMGMVRRERRESVGSGGSAGMKVGEGVVVGFGDVDVELRGGGNAEGGEGSEPG